MSNDRNSFTGMSIKPHDNTELNSLTGQYEEQDDNNGESKWPSISKRDENDPEPSISKSTDENPFPSLTSHLVGSVSKVQKSIEMNVPIIAAVEKSKDEHIVYGIVYEPDTVDAQGDSASAEEIEKAANYFMENNPTFKIMHKGKNVDIKVLQSFIAPADYTINERNVKKGSWILVTRINDKKLWKDIKAGKFTGYSMAGYARVA